MTSFPLVDNTYLKPTRLVRVENLLQLISLLGLLNEYVVTEKYSWLYYKDNVIHYVT